MFHFDMTEKQKKINFGVDSEHTYQSKDSFSNWELLPMSVVDSHKVSMDISTNVWKFNVPTANASFNWLLRKIDNPWLLYSLKRHTIFCIRKVSPQESYNTIRINTLFLSKTASWKELRTARTFSQHESALYKVMTEVLSLLRQNKTLYNFARLRAWYSWCTDYLPDCGFDVDHAYQWQIIRVPGNEKGVAVRIGDADSGPLHDSELILVRRALQSDDSQDPAHVFQRLAVWLCIVFGRNPANFAQLRVKDLVNLTKGSEVDTWILKIPRIKKRGVARSQFKDEYVSPELAKVVMEALNVEGDGWSGSDDERPLLLRATARTHLLGTAMNQWAWHLTSAEFTTLVRAAIGRYNIISPRTGELLQVSTRRFRYTFATNRVREGISARDLAEALDHTDLQHVRVYFDAQSSVVERLDVAAAKEIAPKLALFTGKLVPDDGGNHNKHILIVPELIKPDKDIEHLGKCGKNEFCTLYPPYSCYPCSRFEPFVDSLPIHTMVLEHLLERRQRLLSESFNSSRIAVQLDEVIYACAHLIVKLEKLSNEDEVENEFTS